jgi:hypothetical protein
MALVVAGVAVVVLAMRLLDGRHDRVLASQRFGMELGMLFTKMLLELRIEAESQWALGTVQSFHERIVALPDVTR